MTSTARREIPPIRTVADLLDALRVNDSERNARAIEVARGFNPLVVSHPLVLELTNRRFRPAHRVRLAEAIAQLGSPPDPADSLTLLTIAFTERNPEVREAIGKALARHRQNEVDWSSGTQVGATPQA